MKSEKEIQDRINEISAEIENWTKERRKTGTHAEYITYCCEILSGFNGEKASLMWVLNNN